METIKFIQLLGKKVTDPVSGFSGVIKSVSFDMNGCIQGLVQPSVKDSIYPDSIWFDVKSLKMNRKIVDPPDFDYNYQEGTDAIKTGEKGSVSKPIK